MEVDSVIMCLILVVLVILALSVFALVWYCGLFAQLDIKTCRPPFKSLEVAYKFAKAPYSDSGTLFREAHGLAPGLRCIGVYYDNITDVYDKVRYIIGLVLNDEGKTVDDETRNLIQSKGYQFVTFPEVDHIVHSTFPHKGPFSVLIAVSRLVPAFKQYIKDQKLEAYPLIEFCDGIDIAYAAPLSKQREFFVPEALAESEEDPTSDPQTIEETEDASVKDAEELQADTASSVDSLADGQSRDGPSLEIIDSLEDNRKNGTTNGSEASTESFEELQLDS